MAALPPRPTRELRCSSTPSTQSRGHRPGRRGTWGQYVWKAGASPDSTDQAEGPQAGHFVPLGLSFPHVSPGNWLQKATDLSMTMQR